MFRSYLEIFKTLLIPNEIHHEVEQIDEGTLYNKGFRTIFLDIDNTVMGYSEREISLKKATWVKRVIASGFKVYIVSNNSGFRRINRVAKELNITGTYFSMKPFSFSFRDLANRYNIDFTKSITIGDQLFTDVIGGNWCKTYTILVDPLDKKLSFIKTLQRELELYLIKKFK
mgnify:CR=1 FL=1